MNRQTKRMMQRQGQVAPDGSPAEPRRATQTRPVHKPPSKRTSPATFLKEVRGELRKVAWPSRAEVVNYSTVVLFTLVLLIALIFLLDLVFAKAVLFLFKT
jgi:preprotein translocase subunit SecE